MKNDVNAPAGKLALLTKEYKAMVREVGITRGLEISDEQALYLSAQLVTNGDWSRQGAMELVYLARQYGRFFLRNAYALARAMDIEDGLRGL